MFQRALVYVMSMTIGFLAVFDRSIASMKNGGASSGTGSWPVRVEVALFADPGVGGLAWYPSFAMAATNTSGPAILES